MFPKTMSKIIFEALDNYNNKYTKPNIHKVRPKLCKVIFVVQEFNILTN